MTDYNVYQKYITHMKSFGYQHLENTLIFFKFEKDKEYMFEIMYPVDLHYADEIEFKNFPTAWKNFNDHSQIYRLRGKSRRTLKEILLNFYYTMRDVENYRLIDKLPE